MIDWSSSWTWSSSGECRQFIACSVHVLHKKAGREILASWDFCEQVFEVEDADGPVEGAEQDSIAARFGRLKVADASNVGLPGEQLAVLADAQRALAAEPTGIEADLNLWRQHLGISPAAGGLIFGSLKNTKGSGSCVSVTFKMAAESKQQQSR